MQFVLLVLDDVTSPSLRCRALDPNGSDPWRNPPRGPPAPLGPGVPFFGPMLGSAGASRSRLARPAHRLV